MQNENGSQQHQTGPTEPIEPTHMDAETPNTVMETDDDNATIPHPPRENEYDDAKRRKRIVGGRNKTWYVSSQPGHKKLTASCYYCGRQFHVGEARLQRGRNVTSKNNTFMLTAYAED